MPAEAKEPDADATLVDRMAAGDERALAEIVRRHGSRLKAILIRFTGGAAAADDILQETFVSAWRGAARWRADGPPYAAYLTRIAVNRAIDSERRSRLRRFFGIAEAEDVVDPAVSAEGILAGRNELANVTADIRTLPARQRAAILLAAGGEHSTAEIAAMMGLSAGAAEQLLVRARKTLRAGLRRRAGKEVR